MKTMSEIQEVWLAAERDGDPEALSRVLADDFRAVGPVGFVLDKGQWVDRYRTGELNYEHLDLEDIDIRTHGDTVVVIARWVQQGAIGERRVDGEFRVTQIFQREGDDWMLEGIHLSPIASPNPGPPPS
jgi:ketosteroid isomerase-like protein